MQNLKEYPTILCGLILQVII